MEFDIKFIEQIVKLLEEHKLGKIKLQDGEKHLSISAPITKVHHTSPLPPVFSNPQVPQAPSTEQSIQQQNNETSEAQQDAIKAPFVGTIYISPSPTDPPFIEVGKRVNKGDILFIVEAMKIMNQIKSPITGHVEKILVSNEQAVEFDQPLVIIH